MRKILLLACLLLLLLPSEALALGPGSNGPAVSRLNLRLASLGYLPAGSDSQSYGSQTTFAVTAFQKQGGLSRDGVAGSKTLSRLRRAVRPHPAFRGKGRRVEISLSKQLLYLIHGNWVKRVIPISSGRPGLSTPRGLFAVYSQSRMSWSHAYSSWMPYASYFHGGYAMHGYPNYEVPSYPASHGCVRIPMDFAYEVYHYIQVGDSVRIY